MPSRPLANCVPIAHEPFYSVLKDRYRIDYALRPRIPAFLSPNACALSESALVLIPPFFRSNCGSPVVGCGCLFQVNRWSLPEALTMGAYSCCHATLSHQTTDPHTRPRLAVRRIDCPVLSCIRFFRSSLHPAVARHRVLLLSACHGLTA